MQYKLGHINKPFLSVIAIGGWFAIVVQFYLLMQFRKLSVPATILQFFSFFTILTNIIVAVCCTTLVVKPNSRWGHFFCRSGVLTAIALYIIMVGLVYNFVLRFLWAPRGLQKVVDELLHTFIPLLFILYWALFVHKNMLQWKNVFAWLLFPFFYSLYVLARGALTGLYPYPFMDVGELGYKTVLINCGYLVVVFFLAALLFIAVSKVSARYGSKRERFQ